jgi:outer membrane protein OmpA-like peptidoglycan-associated protein
MNRKKLGNAPLKSIPVYDVPVVVETKPEPEAPVKTIDTAVEKVVILETKPEPEVVVPVETKPEVDLSELAKQSTTYYAFNVADLTNENKENLAPLISYMQANPKCKTTIYGNADRLGSESYNLTLSASRAKNVKAYLVSQGVPANRIKVVAYGEQKATGETEEERAINRCVEFGITNE